MDHLCVLDLPYKSWLPWLARMEKEGLRHLRPPPAGALQALQAVGRDSKASSKPRIQEWELVFRGINWVDQVRPFRAFSRGVIQGSWLHQYSPHMVFGRAKLRQEEHVATSNNSNDLHYLQIHKGYML